MKTELKKRFKRGKKEIQLDILDGTLPKDVKSFSQLHEYVDANKYGGFFDPDYKLTYSYTFENDVQTLLDHWIKKRYLKNVKKDLAEKRLRNDVGDILRKFGFDYCIPEFEDLIDYIVSLIELKHCELTEKDLLIYSLTKLTGYSYNALKNILTNK